MENEIRDNEVTLTRETITPDKAREYLERNTMNRATGRTGEQHVRDLAAMMSKGQWKANPSSPVSFARGGILLNGQHRLRAVIKSGTAQVMYVLRGCDPDDFMVIDTGMSRNAGHLFSIEGAPNPIQLAACIARYFALKGGVLAAVGVNGGYVPGHKRVAFDDFMCEYESSPALYQDIIFFAKSVTKVKWRGGKKVLCASVVGAYCVYLIKDKFHDADKVKGFFGELCRERECNTPVIGMLRERLRYDESLTVVERNRLLVKAWNMYITGRKVAKLIVRKDERLELI